MPLSVTPEQTLERLISIHSPRSEDKIRRDWNLLPERTKGQFMEAYHRSDEELVFAFKYVRYYLSTRVHKILEDQLFWTMRYTFIIAPLMSALPLEKPFNIGFVGNLVEYSFNSVRFREQPDPADYDVDVVWGAVIMRVLDHYDYVGPDSETAREIGAAWETVAKHWGLLESNGVEHAHALVKNLADGGSIHLSDGLL